MERTPTPLTLIRGRTRMSRRPGPGEGFEPKMGDTAWHVVEA
jgi:hypothetical protein